MENIEKIGNIILDYTCYPGEDYYCDGAVEDELLRIVQEKEPGCYAEAIEEKGEWPVLYHLSPLRGNIVDWIPLNASDKVLEVGSGCGAVTGKLAEKAGEVTCIDLSRKRSLINAYRHRNRNNVTIQVGNFKEIEQKLPCDYDYIFLIGVFEYGKSYIGGETPYEEFLSIIRKHLGHGGRIVIAIENKFGLKYWAGCKEDHLGTYFSGIEDYAAGGGVRTFTRKGLERICRAEGIENYSFYYPYPDYKFPTVIYSDRRLPKVGELTTNLCNYDRDRMLLFDEKNAFDGIIREGEFPLFSNSYLLVIGDAFPAVYTKYSNDRAPEFAIRTQIAAEQQAGDGAVRYRVEKTAAGKAAEVQIQRIKTAYRLLCERYEGGSLGVNRCMEAQDDSRVELAYVEGRTLEELLDECLDREDEAGFRRLFEEYCRLISYRAAGAEGETIDYDLIFGNLIASSGCKGSEGEREWTILDYEWTLPDYGEIFGRTIQIRDVILRALYCYRMGAWKRRKLSYELIMELSGEDDSVLLRLEEEEKLFQKYVTGNRMALADLRNRIGHAILPVQQLVQQQTAVLDKRRVQIYPDTGAGFSEETSRFAEGAVCSRESSDGGYAVTLELTVPREWRTVRIDPAMQSCLIHVQQLCLRQAGRDRQLSLLDKSIGLNGDLISGDSIVFTTEDPNLTVDLSALGLDHTEEVILCAGFRVIPMPPETAQAAAAGLPKKGWFGR